MLTRDSLLDQFLWEVGQGTVDRAAFAESLKKGEASDLEEFLAHSKREGVGVKGRREAAFVLLSLGKDEAVGVLSDLLSDPMTAAAILSAIRDDESMRAWFESDEFRERVAALTESGELENPASLISLGVLLGVPKLASRAMGSVASMPVLTRVHTLSALVGGDHDAEVLGHLLDATAELESESQGCRTAFDRLQEFIEGDDEALAKQVQAFLEKRFKDRSPARPEFPVVEGFLARCTKKSLSIIERLLDDSRDMQISGLCMRALLRLDEKKAVDRVAESFGQKKLGVVAAQAFGAHFAGKEEKEIIDLIANGIPEDSTDASLQEMVRSIALIGGKHAAKISTGLVEERIPKWKTELDRLLGNVSFGEVLAQAVKDSVIAKAPTKKAIAQIRKEAGEGASFADLLTAVFGERGILVRSGIDTQELPVQHPELVREFAEVSLGAFEPSDIEQTWNQTRSTDEEADYTVNFTASGKAYEFTAGNHRHYYDARSVARAVNEALEVAKAELRFSAWNECHILTTPGALETFAARFQLESLIK